MNPMMKHTTPRKGQSVLILFIAAALIVLAVILIPQTRNGQLPEYELRIKELGGDSMLAYSTSEELGYGEILLVYAENMVVEDINGQLIDYAELNIANDIRVTILPREKDPEYDRYLDPVVSRIVLLPDDSDEYI